MERARPSHADGFSLVELVVVIVIVSVIAAIAVPRLSRAAFNSRQSAFAANLMTLEKAAQLMHAETGEWPEDSRTGRMPTGFDAYIVKSDWVGTTPIGGYWDSEFEDAWDFRAAIGVHFVGGVGNPGADYMQQIDRMIGDGDLRTGAFQRIAVNRYYTILER